MATESYALASISMQEVFQAQHTIAYEMKKNTALRVGCMLTALGATCGGLYYILSPQQPLVLDTQLSSPDTKKDQLNQLLISIQQQLIKVNETVSEANQNHYILREQGILTGSIFSFNYWKRLFPQTLLTILLSAVITGGLGPIGKYFKRFDDWVDSTASSLFHDRTIGWFVNTRTHTFELLELVKKDIQAASVERLNVSWELMRKDIIQLLGFITYQKSCIDIKLEYALKRFDQIVEKIFHSFEKARSCLINHCVQGAISDFQMIDALKDELDTALQECALIESLHTS